MSTPTEHPAPAGRNDSPVERQLEALRRALDSMTSAQEEGRKALDAVRTHLADPLPPKPDPDWLRPAPWEDPRPADRSTPAPVRGDRPVPASADPSTPPDVGAALRKAYVGLHRAAIEVDRLDQAESLQAYLWSFARVRGLRAMRLQEKGRALYAEDASGFANFDGDRISRLRKVVVPFDPEGLFGATAQDRAVYSGPRPAKGMPVDLVLVMGKQAPDWCLVVPMPYRNRWGTFLYFDSVGKGIEGILELELVARLVVLQLRAARVRPHTPADRVRAFRAATLRERQQRRARKLGTLAHAEDGATRPGDEQPHDPLSRKRAGAVDPRQPVDASRFDDDGELVRPLTGNEILARIGDLPAMPHVATRLIGLLNDPETEIKQLQELISTDQSIAVRLLQIANSSLYGNLQEVSTIGEAIMRLGFTAIRSWLLATVTRQIFVGRDANASTMMLWRQSVIGAIGAEILARRSAAMDPETAFVGGLMQNVGLLVLARSHPDVFDEIDLRSRAAGQGYVELERRTLGFDHADVGAILLQRWGLSSTLVDAVSAHHRLEHAGREDGFAAIVALSEELALRLGGGPTEERDDDLAETAAARLLELDSSTLREVAEEIAQRILDRELFD